MPAIVTAPGPRLTAGSGPVLALRDVSKTFEDGTAALRGVSFEVNPGELVTLVGPSGCGKTTALRLAAGLESASVGQVVRRSDAEASLSFVFQDPTLLEWRTAVGNVELVAELRHVPRAQRRARAREALHAVGLSDAAGKRPRQLSGGMRMRVSLARALVTDPVLALFDEPFGALDELTRLQLQTLLHELFASRRAAGSAVAGLFITHSVPEAVYLSDRVLVMAPGVVHAEVAIPSDGPFSRPRPADLRYTPEFAALAGRVSALLAEAMAHTSPGARPSAPEAGGAP